ncbi:MAG TPA: sugar ABC transporter ATP-binding protein [Atribacteraceae bacterium]|nr:sugar ABC transporter ATP-binding protein [Atribacteraceae bacterium]
MNEFVLELKGISKNFPGVKALESVDFNLKPGEIHALVGENGAGKSTLIKIITGVFQPDKGEILFHGKKILISNPTVAQKHLIAAIYQYPTCFPHLTVMENIFMGHPLVEPRSRHLLWKEMRVEAKRLLKSLGTDLNPNLRMGDLSIAQQQMVEIAKALSLNARILIMDEPTAALTKGETEELYAITRRLRNEGTSIIFISHRFEDIYQIAERVTVFRDGKSIGTWPVPEISEAELIKAMVGREINQLFPKSTVPVGKEALRVEGLSRVGYFADISFSLREGEILGFSGLVGSGRSEVAQAIFGIHPSDRGKIFVRGKECTIDSPWKAMELGIGYLPEDRQIQGLVLPLTITDNITLSTLDRYARRGWLKNQAGYKVSQKLFELLKIKAPSIFEKTLALSGGNQQKVVVGKLLAGELHILILDEPTKGVDVGAKSAIHQIMSDLAAEGFALIMISSEMPEILGMSDTIIVMREGRITRTFSREETTQEKLLAAAVEVNR